MAGTAASAELPIYVLWRTGAGRGTLWSCSGCWVWTRGVLGELFLSFNFTADDQAEWRKLESDCIQLIYKYTDAIRGDLGTEPAEAA